MVTRIVKLNNQHGVIVGRDLFGMLEDGMVYNISKVMDEFIMTPIGKSASIMVGADRFPDFKGSDPRTKTQLLMDGATYITEEEYKAQEKSRERRNAR